MFNQLNQQGDAWLQQAQAQQAQMNGIGGIVQYRGSRPEMVQIPKNNEQRKEKKSMVKEIREDMRAFMHEHKSVIYWALILYVVDHYCFEGACKQRLQKMVHNLVGKVEAKLDQAKI